MTYSYIDYTVSGRLGWIALNRPEKRNALNGEVVAELTHAFEAAAADEAVKVIILEGKGEAFCAGADLGYLQQLQQNSFGENLEDSRQLKALFSLIYTLNKVVIAMAEGHAIAGGAGLATVCDFCFAVPAAKIGYTEVKIGFIPAIVSLFLIRKIGEGKARELLLRGNLIDASEAADLGLVNQVVDAAQIRTYVTNFANGLCEQASTNSLAATKSLIAKVQDLPLEAALEYAASQNARTREHPDCKAGIAAFLNKEKPSW